MMFEYCDTLIKSLFIGDSKSGKTIIQQYIKTGNLLTKYETTIGIDFIIKTCTSDKGYRIKHQMWDTAGDPRFIPITIAYYRGSKIFVIVHRQGEDTRKWHVTISNHSFDDTPIILDVTTYVGQFPSGVVQGDQGNFHVSLDTGEGINELVKMMTELTAALPGVKDNYEQRLRKEAELVRLKEAELARLRAEEEEEQQEDREICTIFHMHSGKLHKVMKELLDKQQD